MEMSRYSLIAFHRNNMSQEGKHFSEIAEVLLELPGLGLAENSGGGRVAVTAAALVSVGPQE